MAVTVDQPASGPQRRVLAIGASLTLAGIALSVTTSQALGSWLTVGALLVMLYGLHRLGRLGPDEPLKRRDLRELAEEYEASAERRPASEEPRGSTNEDSPESSDEPSDDDSPDKPSDDD